MEHKKQRKVIDEGIMLLALQELRDKTMSLHQACHHYGIAKTTLLTRFKRAKEEMGDSQNLTLKMGLKHRDVNNKFATKQVLTMKEEENLARYLLECSKMNYGLTLKDTRKLAYTYAVSEGRTIPDNWSEDKMAGKTWARGFLRRHKYAFFYSQFQYFNSKNSFF